MTTSSNGNVFRVTDPLWDESTGHLWIPFTKSSNAELLSFLWSESEQTVEQTIGTPMVSDTITPIVTSLQWRACLSASEETDPELRIWYYHSASNLIFNIFWYHANDLYQMISINPLIGVYWSHVKIFLPIIHWTLTQPNLLVSINICLYLFAVSRLVKHGTMVWP